MRPRASTAVASAIPPSGRPRNGTASPGVPDANHSQKTRQSLEYWHIGETGDAITESASANVVSGGKLFWSLRIGPSGVAGLAAYRMRTENRGLQETLAPILIVRFSSVPQPAFARLFFPVLTSFEMRSFTSASMVGRLADRPWMHGTVTGG